MAKEFKDFDKKYAHLAGTALKQVFRSIGIGKDEENQAHADIAEFQLWMHFDQFTEDYSMSSIRYAVYEAPGAEEWQKFRVSLKGLTTREKLFALEWYWDLYVTAEAGLEYRSRQIIRVNNYLGALKRGGQLDSDLRVKR